jgi:hypothetical protein
MLNGDRYSDVDGTVLNIGQDERVIRTYATGHLAVALVSIISPCEASLTG